MTRRYTIMAWAAACMAVSLQPCESSAAEPGHVEHDLQIERQPLGRALQELARQSGIQIIFFSSITEGREAPSLNGRFTTEAALEQMLVDTRLTFREIHPNTVQICLRNLAPCAPAAMEPPRATKELEMQSKPKEATNQTSMSKGANVKTENFLAALLMSASTFTLSPQARAQAGAPGPAAALEEVVVTGSRVITNGNNSPTPVTIVTAEELMTARPGNVADALNDLPAFTQTRNQTTNPGTGGGQAANSAANNAINTMNMRALGSSRTLVLYNGKRLPAVSPEGWTDVNLIPQMLLKRVDTVTGGASAVYGSDAIGGVVNFISDREFNGIKGELRAGRSNYGDGDMVAGGLAFGTDLFGGRGHFMASYNTNNDAGVGSRLSRPWGRRTPMLLGGGISAPLAMFLDARQAQQSFGGKINSATVTSGPSLITAATANNLQFVGVGGYPVAFSHGLAGLANGIHRPEIEIGGDGGYQDSTLKSELDLHSVFGRFDFDFTDNLHGYVDASGLYSYSSQALGYATLAQNTGFSGQNSFLASPYQFNGTFTMGKMMTGLPRQITQSYMHENYVLAGLEGAFGDGYKWTVAGNTGTGTQNTRWVNHFNNQKLAAALDAVVDASGRVVCYAATQAATAAAYADCVPLNAFGTKSESAAAINYVSTTIQDWLTNKSKGFSGDITGAPISSWAGPINMALSGEWRKSTYRATSTSLPTDRGGRASCAGLRTFGGAQCNANTTLYQVAVADRSEVSQTVSEAAIEADIPLLKDVSLARSLSTNLAARYARYSNSDGAASNPHFDATTWKVGVVWDVIDALTVRATRSRDFRAPNLDELYRPITIGVNNGPTVGNLATPVAPGGALTFAGGNDKVQPEKADATTLGLVYRATPNLSFALDGFHFKVRDAIYFLNGFGLGPTCIPNPTVSICDFFQVNSAGQITVLKTGNINAAELETYGVDFETNWRTTLMDRPLAVRALVTWQPHFTYDIPGSPRLEQAGVASSFGQAAVGAKVRVTATLNYKPTDSIGITVVERWRSSMGFTDTPTFIQKGKVASVAYTNLNIAYTPKMDIGKMEYFLNVQNIFNTDPPPSHPGSPVAPGTFGGAAPGDDVMGRFYTAGLRFRY